MERRTIKSAFLDPAGLRFASLSFASTFCFLDTILIVFETIHGAAERVERAPRICNHTDIRKAVSHLLRASSIPAGIWAISRTMPGEVVAQPRSAEQQSAHELWNRLPLSL